MTNDVIVKKKTTKPYTHKSAPISIVMEKEMPFYGLETLAVKEDTHDLISKSRNGVAMRQIQKYMDTYNLTLKEMASILNISERTLQRYEPKDILSKDVSDRALHLQRLYERGAEVFGTLDNFKGWMKSSILIFNNEKPISFLDTIFGFELLEKELGRIEHGIFA